MKKIFFVLLGLVILSSACEGASKDKNVKNEVITQSAVDSHSSTAESSVQSVPAVLVINETSPGMPVDYMKFAVAGKTVIFDFYSEYCPPCVRIAPKLVKLAEVKKEIIIRKIDINRKDVRGIDWSSPLARQYSLNSIPHFVIVGPDGKVMLQGDDAAEQIYQWLSEANL